MGTWKQYTAKSLRTSHSIHCSSDLGLSLTVRPRHATAYTYIQCLFNSVATACVGPFFCFTMTLPPCTKPGPERNGFPRFMWENLTGLAQSPDLNPINTLEMNPEYWLWAGPYHPTSVLGLIVVGAEWERIAAAMFQTSGGKTCQKCGGCYRSILMTMVLNSHVWSSCLAGPLRCPGHQCTQQLLVNDNCSCCNNKTLFYTHCPFV